MADLGFMPDVRKILDMTPATPPDHAVVGDARRRRQRADPRLPAATPPATTSSARSTTATSSTASSSPRRWSRVDASVELMKTHGPTIVFVKTRFGVDDVTAALMNAGVRAGVAARRAHPAGRTPHARGLQARQGAGARRHRRRRSRHPRRRRRARRPLRPARTTRRTTMHRSGRTGRAGRDGTVVAFVPPSRQRVARAADRGRSTSRPCGQEQGPTRAPSVASVGVRRPRRTSERRSRDAATRRPARRVGDRTTGRRTTDRDDRPRTERTTAPSGRATDGAAAPSGPARRPPDRDGVGSHRRHRGAPSRRRPTGDPCGVDRRERASAAASVPHRATAATGGSARRRPLARRSFRPSRGR